MGKESLIVWQEWQSTELVSLSSLTDTIIESRSLTQADILSEPLEVKVQRTESLTILGEFAQMLLDLFMSVTRRTIESKCSRATVPLLPSLVAKETSLVSWSILTTLPSAATTESLYQTQTITDFKYSMSMERF